MMSVMLIDTEERCGSTSIVLWMNKKKRVVPPVERKTWQRMMPLTMSAMLIGTMRSDVAAC
jgi:hypothetical protein